MGARAAIAAFLAKGKTAAAGAAEAGAAAEVVTETAETTKAATPSIPNPASNIKATDAEEVSSGFKIKPGKSGGGFKWKTPGGIAAMLLFAIVVVFAITKAPGHDSSRLRVLWDVLLKGGHFAGSADAANEAAGITMPETAAKMDYASSAAYVDSKLAYI